jgi:hypothetical protein
VQDACRRERRAAGAETMFQKSDKRMKRGRGFHRLKDGDVVGENSVAVATCSNGGMESKARPLVVFRFEFGGPQNSQSLMPVDARSSY